MSDFDCVLTSYAQTYKPFHEDWAMELAKEHENKHWIEEEADLSSDVSDWKNKLTDSERNLVHQILRLFTQSDVQVGQNYCEFYIPTFKNNEVRCMLLSFAAREGVHQRAYALLNDTINLPESDYRAFLDYEEMADKIEFMADQCTDTKVGVGLALSKTVFNEGCSLFGAFSLLFNLTRSGRMKGMGEIVRWSIEDEDLHVQGMSKLFRRWCEEHPSIVTDEFKRNIYEQARITAELECAFIELAFDQFEIANINKDEIKAFVKYLCDRRLTQMGLKPNFNVPSNPLPWMDEIVGGSTLTNRFEARATDYTKVSMEGVWGW
jgi:ribonucleotide reductase beta subunit family protein with ferritin-like domain